MRETETANVYRFEMGWSTKPRAEQQAEVERNKLTARLGFTSTNPSSIFDVKLTDFVIHCHLAIEWYEKSIRKELRWRRLYFAVSLLLLLLIPTAVFLLPQYLGSNVGGSSNAAARLGSGPLVIGQISSALTGIFAFYRGISAWLDKRQVVGNFSKAASDLKQVLYTFEQTWDGVATNPARATDFEGAIVITTNICRGIVDRETVQYYANLTYPSLDLGSLLQSSSADAASLVSKLAMTPPVTSNVMHAAESATSTPNPAVMSAKVNQIRAQVQQLDTQLLSLAGTGTPAQIAAINAARDGAVRDLRAAELSVAAASG
jgi:hypothetical protein